jgi:hypothetical protein
MSEWQNPPRSNGFSVDPVTAPQLRPSDADRTYVESTLHAARAEGRITETELVERVDRTSSATTLGELLTLIDDVSVPTVAGPDSSRLPVVPMSAPLAMVRPGPPDFRRGARIAIPRAVVSWLALAVLFNVIWVFTLGISSSFHGYYWPIWPMLGTAIPVIGLLVSVIGSGPSRPGDPEPPTDLR